MASNLNLIVMLTHNDRTVGNAYEIFRECKDSKAEYWGFKEKSLPLDEMKDLYKLMKDCKKTTFLEVVEYTEEKGLEGARIAVECGCDILMGTVFFDSINEFCKKNNMKYMPFVGKVTERPSVLEGEINEIIDEAKNYIEKGVYGIDLLGYRYKGNAEELNRKLVAQIEAPVCIAGSIDSYKRLREVKEISPWAFTIGGAFFENKFGKNFEEQINRVCEYIENKDVTGEENV